MVYGDEADDDKEVEERVRNLLVQFPGKELRIRSALADFEGHAGRAALELQSEEDNADAPCRYVIVVRSFVKEGFDPSSEKIQDLLPETIVEVAEVAENLDARRIRGRLVEPAGWISLMNTETGQRWAEKVDDEPGEYRIMVPVHVKVNKELTSARVADIPRDMIVNVVEVRELAEDKRVRGRINSPQEGWISLQSIENGLRWARKINKPLTKRYRVDGKLISSQKPGLNFRLSPNLDDKDQGDDKICLYGSIVTGVQLHDWLKIHGEGATARYLPFNVQGVRVLYELDEGGQDVLPGRAARAGFTAEAPWPASSPAPRPEFAPEPRVRPTAADPGAMLMGKVLSGRRSLSDASSPLEDDDADGDSKFEFLAALEGFPEPRPNFIFGTDPRAPPGAQEGVGVIAFCFPGYPERWDELCGAPFLGHHWNLGRGGISVAGRAAPEAPRAFCNAEAAFHALSFWDQAERFEGLTGDEALALKEQLSETRDPTFAGHGSEWCANLAVLRAKFRPGSPNAEALLRTRDSFLLEHVAEAFDKVWSNNHVGDGKNWNGLQLMLVRDDISGRSNDVRSWTQYIKNECQVDLETGDCRASSASDLWSDAVIGSTDALQLTLGEAVQRRRQTFSRLPSSLEEEVEDEEDEEEPPIEAPLGTGKSLELPTDLPSSSLREKREDEEVEEEPPTEAPVRNRASTSAATDVPLTKPLSDVSPVSDGAPVVVSDREMRPAPKRIQRTLSQAFKQRHAAAGIEDPPLAPVSSPIPEADAPEEAMTPKPRSKTFGRSLSTAFKRLEETGVPVPSPRGDAPEAFKRLEARAARPSMVTRTLSKAFAARAGLSPGTGD